MKEGEAKRRKVRGKRENKTGRENIRSPKAGRVNKERGMEG